MPHTLTCTQYCAVRYVCYRLTIPNLGQLCNTAMLEQTVNEVVIRVNNGKKDIRQKTKYP